jgi:glyoxylase-like metal-dependent hydrolase (beta-lactamase superfamily II)
MHSYLVIGCKSAALIDTGLGVGNIREAALRLTGLPIQVITTHAHWDHIGGHCLFDDIRIHHGDANWLIHGFPLPLEAVKGNLLKEPCVFPSGFDIDKYAVFRGNPAHILHEGDMVDLGGRQLQVIHTPGHSPGHICLYEDETGYLFSGDLIYKGTLDAYYPSTSPVDFMNSVNKVRSLPVKKILPAHYSLDVPNSIIGEISDAFAYIHNRGELMQGKGKFAFKSFRIHI